MFNNDFVSPLLLYQFVPHIDLLSCPIKFK